MLWYLDKPRALLWVAPYPGDASVASAKMRSVAKSNTRVNEALRTGMLCTQPQSMRFDHYYASGNQHTLSSRKPFFSLAIVCSVFNSATHAQTSETSSRSQGGVMLWFRAAAAH